MTFTSRRKNGQTFLWPCFATVLTNYRTYTVRSSGPIYLFTARPFAKTTVVYTTLYQHKHVHISTSTTISNKFSIGLNSYTGEKKKIPTVWGRISFLECEKGFKESWSRQSLFETNYEWRNQNAFAVIPPHNDDGPIKWSLKSLPTSITRHLRYNYSHAIQEGKGSCLCKRHRRV